MHHPSGGGLSPPPPISSRTSSSNDDGLFVDEDEIFYRNYRLTREMAGRDKQLPEVKGDPSHKPRPPPPPPPIPPSLPPSIPSSSEMVDHPTGVRPRPVASLPDSTLSSPQRLLQWPGGRGSSGSRLSRSAETIASSSNHSSDDHHHNRDHKHRKRSRHSKKRSSDEKRVPVSSHSRTACSSLVAKHIDPSTLQSLRSTQLTPLLLKVSSKKHAQETRFTPSPHTNSPIQKVDSWRQEQKTFATPFLPPSILSPSLISLYLTSSERRRALIHPIKTREIRTIRLIVLPPLHFITTRTNECGAELLTSQLLLSPLSPYRARRLNPIWETVTPLHASGHHVAVPFTLRLTPPLTLHRIVTRVQKLKMVDARTLYRHSPKFPIELARSLPRESARLGTVEKEDPQIVRKISIDHMFSTRMTTRAVFKQKRTEIYEDPALLELISNDDMSEARKEKKKKEQFIQHVPHPIRTQQPINGWTSPVDPKGGLCHVTRASLPLPSSLKPSHHKTEVVFDHHPSPHTLKQWPTPPPRATNLHSPAPLMEKQYREVAKTSRPVIPPPPLPPAATHPIDARETPIMGGSMSNEKISIPPRLLPTASTLIKPSNQPIHKISPKPLPPFHSQPLKKKSPLPLRVSSLEPISSEPPDEPKSPSLPIPPPNMPLAPLSPLNLSHEPINETPVKMHKAVHHRSDTRGGKNAAMASTPIGNSLRPQQPISTTPEARTPTRGNTSGPLSTNSDKTRVILFPEGLGRKAAPSTPLKPRPPRKDRPPSGNKKSKFGPRGFEQQEELGRIRLVSDAIKAGEIEPGPQVENKITTLFKKATTPLKGGNGGKKKKKKNE